MSKGILFVTFFYLFSLTACIAEARRQRKECALFKDPDLYYVKLNGPSYIKLDEYDFTGDIEVSFWVLPDMHLHDGPLFSMGSKDNFKYYVWKTKAKKTQYFVVEISHSAVSMLMKAEGQEHLHQIELFTTWPDKYDIATGDWQYIHAYRINGVWGLSLNDTIKVNQDVQESSDIFLYNRNGFLGGRPDYDSNVFRGIIKDLHINGERVELSGRDVVGNAEIHDCRSKEVRDFAKSLYQHDD